MDILATRMLQPAGRPSFQGTQPQPMVVVERRWVVLALLPLLSLLFQCWFYAIDAGPIYYLSKVFVILAFPLAVYAMVRVPLPQLGLYAVMLAYVLGVTPILAMLHLQANFLEAIIASSKVWGFLHLFVAAAILHLLRPTEAEIRRSVLWLSAGTFLLYWALWLLLPESAYRADPAESTIFLREETGRGNRIVLMMPFCFIGMFWLARSWSQRPRWWHLAGLAVGFLTMLLLYKARLQSASVGLITLFLLALRLPPAARVVLGAGAAVGLGVVLLSAGALRVDGIAEQLGGSLSIRQTSSDLALRYLGDDPLRWIFGVGSTTGYSRLRLADILGYSMFYLADIGWLGVIVEFGLIGSGLLAAVYVLTWRAARRAATAGEPFRLALGDYMLHLCLISPISSVVYTPGEVASIGAIAAYLVAMPRKPA
jgi:hypothetical protein